MPVPGGVGRRDDLDLLDGLKRRRALVALLVAARVAKGGAVEEVLGGHRLAAVDAGVELAAAEHRVAVGPHRQVARLHEQDRVGQPHVGAGDERQVLVILLVDGVADVRPGLVDAADPCDLNRLGQIAELERDVMSDRVGALEQDP